MLTNPLFALAEAYPGHELQQTSSNTSAIIIPLDISTIDIPDKIEKAHLRIDNEFDSRKHSPSIKYPNHISIITTNTTFSLHFDTNYQLQTTYKFDNKSLNYVLLTDKDNQHLAKFEQFAKQQFLRVKDYQKNTKTKSKKNVLNEDILTKISKKIRELQEKPQDLNGLCEYYILLVTKKNLLCDQLKDTTHINSQINLTSKALIKQAFELSQDPDEIERLKLVVETLEKNGNGFYATENYKHCVIDAIFAGNLKALKYFYNTYKDNFNWIDQHTATTPLNAAIEIYAQLDAEFGKDNLDPKNLLAEHLNIIKWLIETAKTDVNKTDSGGVFPLILITSYPQSSNLCKLFQFLLDNNANIDQAFEVNQQISNSLINYKSFYNYNFYNIQLEIFGNTALMNAALNKNYPLLMSYVTQKITNKQSIDHLSKAKNSHNMTLFSILCYQYLFANNDERKIINAFLYTTKHIYLFEAMSSYTIIKHNNKYFHQWALIAISENKSIPDDDFIKRFLKPFYESLLNKAPQLPIEIAITDFKINNSNNIQLQLDPLTKAFDTKIYEKYFKSSKYTWHVQSDGSAVLEGVKIKKKNESSFKENVNSFFKEKVTIDKGKCQLFLPNALEYLKQTNSNDHSMDYDSIKFD